MYTGIVEEMGRVVEVARNKLIKMWNGEVAEGMELTIMTKKTMQDAKIGCSIAVNGICLSVTNFGSMSDWKPRREEEKEGEGIKEESEIQKEKRKNMDDTDDDDEFKFFTVGITPETLRKTDLKEISVGDAVNLERAMAGKSRSSGHTILGHVDATGILIQKWQEGNSLWLKVEVDQELMPLIVTKGSIALGGVSLTVCDVNQKERWFSVMLVPITQKIINLPLKNIGSLINVEVDILGKYVQRVVQGFVGAKLEEFEERMKKLEEKARIKEEAVDAEMVDLKNRIKKLEKESC